MNATRLVGSVSASRAMRGTEQDRGRKDPISTSHVSDKCRTDQCKPFGLARMGGSFTKYLQTSHYLKLPDIQLIGWK